MTRPQHPADLELLNARGEERGFVDPKQIEDLWIMQGSVCDLRCKHCYTASSPSNNRLEQIPFAELKPHLEDAARFGLQKIYFTGGEVFVNDDVLRGRAGRNEEFLKNLAFALEIAPVEVLTNGRKHILSHLDALRALRQKHADRLTLRITLESPNAGEHDAIRGQSTFAQTTNTIRQLAAEGFSLVIAAERPLLSIQAGPEIRGAYQSLFPGAALEVNLIENLIEAGHQLDRIAIQGAAPRPEVFLTPACFAILNQPPENLMCHFSRCIQRVDGQIHYYPCPVIYDDPRYELGATLEESLQRVYVAHKNCYDYCMRGQGATCRTRPV